MNGSLARSVDATFHLAKKDFHVSISVTITRHGYMEEQRYFTPERERSLIRAAQSGDKSARDELILGALPFVRKALRRRYPTIDEQDFEDLSQEAVPPLFGSRSLHTGLCL